MNTICRISSAIYTGFKSTTGLFSHSLIHKSHRPTHSPTTIYSTDFYGLIELGDYESGASVCSCQQIEPVSTGHQRMLAGLSARAYARARYNLIIYYNWSLPFAETVRPSALSLTKLQPVDSSHQRFIDRKDDFAVDESAGAVALVIRQRSHPRIGKGLSALVCPVRAKVGCVTGVRRGR